MCTGYDEDDDGEPPEDYREGGYHPVRIGDILHGDFLITAKLGWGMYSTVWMGEDIAGSERLSQAERASMTPNENRRVAVPKTATLFFTSHGNSVKINGCMFH